MDRQTVYTQALGRSTDFLQAQQNIMTGLGWASQSVLGTATVVDGFTLVPTSPVSLVANLTPGAIYQAEPLEATVWSSLPANNASIVKQGLMQAVDPITFTPPATVGYAQCFLVEVQYADLDTSPVLLPYYNASNPQQPYQGPNNSGTSQSTQRLGIAAIQVKAGVAAPSGTQTIPTPDAGWVGLYVVTLAANATTITTGNIATYSAAPFLPVKLPYVPAGVQSGKWVYAAASGTDTYTATLFSTANFSYARTVGMEILVNFANANATTTPTLAENGQTAAQIRKQGGAAPAPGDVSGFVPLVWDGAYWRINGFVPSDLMKVSNGNPNGLVAGTAGSFSNSQPPTFCWDVLDQTLWVCVSTGTAATAVWIQLTYQQLVQATTLYVATTGSDTTGTGSSGTPFATIQKAWNYAQSTYNLSGQTLAISVGAGLFAGIIASGTITGTVSPTSVRIVGAGSGSTTIAGGASNAILATNGAQLLVQGVKLNSASQCCINSQGGSNIIVSSDVNFGGAGACHIYSDTSSNVLNAGSGYTISGNAPVHFNCVNGGRLGIVNTTITLASALTFSTAFINVGTGGVANVNGLTFSGPAATGVRFLVVSAGGINTAGGGANYFPGSAAGSATSPGYYI